MIIGHGRFNRTFMELKLRFRMLPLQRRRSFNRTFMELKLIVCVFLCCC